MKFTFFTNCISPHQLPLAKQLIDNLGVENYRYIYTDALTEERQRMGWGDAVDARWCQQGDASHKALANANILMSELRVLDVFEQRAKCEKMTIYDSERWFKPPLGFLRIFVPSYLKMVKRFAKLLLNSQKFYYYPQGVHAARDMARLVGFLKGDVRCLFLAPKVAFESRPGGVIVPLKEANKAGVLSADEIAFGKKHGFVQIPREHWGKVKSQKVYAKMRMWGYFVEATTSSRQLPVASCELRVGADALDCQCGENHETHETREKGAATPKDSQCGEKPQGYAPEHNVLGNTQNTQKMCSAGRYAQDDATVSQFGVRSSEFQVQRLEQRGGYAQDKQQQTANSKQLTDAPRLRVLWVGRMLKLKRVDTLLKACASEALKDKVELHLYGHGPEEERLKQLAKGAPIHFHDFVPVEQVRDLMRAHDVYVFSSNASDGWGAVVSEALEEGMQVFGTVEAGASGTVLPPTHLFKAGDVKRLTELLLAELPKVSIGEWTAECAADVLQGIMNET